MEFLTTLRLSDSTRKKVVSKNEETCFGRELSKHLHLKFVRDDERGVQSRLSVHHRAFLHDGWMDFLHTGYHDRVPCVADACKISFGIMPYI